MSFDEKFMLRALELADLAQLAEEVPVGCVVVKNGAIIGEGYNRRETGRNALAHAELIAIHHACTYLGGWRLFDCEVYITLEPCPMCAGAIINARIEHVYFGAADPKAGACGSIINLFDLPFSHKPSFTGGILAELSQSKLKGFFASLRRNTKELSRNKMYN